jgi:hypothetical protein
MRVGSVRRHDTRNDPKAAAGIISAGTSATFRAALDEVR